MGAEFGAAVFWGITFLRTGVLEAREGPLSDSQREVSWDSEPAV